MNTTLYNDMVGILDSSDDEYEEFLTWKNNITKQETKIRLPLEQEPDDYDDFLAWKNCIIAKQECSWEEEPATNEESNVYERFLYWKELKQKNCK